MVNLAPAINLKSLTGGFLTNSNPSPKTIGLTPATVTKTNTGIRVSPGQIIEDRRNVFQNSTQRLIDINRQLEVENSLSKTSLFNNQNTLASNQNNIVESLKNTIQGVNTNFQNLGVPNITIQNPSQINPDFPKSNNNQGDPIESKTNFGDIIKQGFTNIFSQIAPSGLVIGAVVLGFLVLRK